MLWLKQHWVPVLLAICIPFTFWTGLRIGAGGVYTVEIYKGFEARYSVPVNFLTDVTAVVCDPGYTRIAFAITNKGRFSTEPKVLRATEFCGDITLSSGQLREIPLNNHGLGI